MTVSKKAESIAKRLAGNVVNKFNNVEFWQTWLDNIVDENSRYNKLDINKMILREIKEDADSLFEEIFKFDTYFLMSTTIYENTKEENKARFFVSLMVRKRSGNNKNNGVLFLTFTAENPEINKEIYNCSLNLIKKNDEYFLSFYTKNVDNENLIHPIASLNMESQNPAYIDQANSIVLIKDKEYKASFYDKLSGIYFDGFFDKKVKNIDGESAVDFTKISIKVANLYTVSKRKGINKLSKIKYLSSIMNI